MLIGTLIYSVVIGFFNDYTNVIDTKSYSITFALAIVLQFLTFLTLLVKKQVVNKSNRFSGKKSKIMLVIGVWAVSFISKFVFLWVISLIFGQSVQINGFLNILIIVLTMLVVQKLVEYIDKKLSS